MSRRQEEQERQLTNIMKTIQYFLVAIIILASASLATAATAGPAPRQYVVVICAGLAPGQCQDVFKQSMDLLLNHAQPGDRVDFIAASQGALLASVSVPEGTARSRANSREYAGKFVGLVQFLKSPSATDSRQATQLRLPQLLDEIARSRHRQDSLTIIAIGSPLYFAANEREAAFDMEKGLTPGDGMIAASVTESLFGTLERKGQLRNTTIHWILPSDDWSVSEMHSHAVTRFWTVFIGEQGATLSTFSSDIAHVFERASQGEASPVLTATLDPNDRGLVMRPPPIFRLETAPPVATHVELPPARTPIQPVVIPTNMPIAIPKIVPVVITPPISTPKLESVAIAKAATEIPQAPSGHIGIAAIWETSASAASTADIDLYVSAHPDTAEVYWKRAQATDAIYYRDIRHAGPQGQSRDWTASWEYVEVNHARIEDVSIWLNVYETKGNAKGIVRIQWNGKIIDAPFQFDLNRGNHGGDNSLTQRRRSPYWQEIRIRDIFTGLYQSDSTTR